MTVSLHNRGRDTHKARVSLRAGSVARHGAVLLACATALLPVYLMFVNTFKPQADIVTNPLSIPLGSFTTEGPKKALGGSTFDFWPAATLSVVLTVLVVVIEIALSGMLAYALTRGTSRVLKAMFAVVVAGLFLPQQLLLLPATQVLDRLNLMNSMAGLVLYEVAQFLPFAVLLYAGFIRQIPMTLDEAAYIDGASTFRVYWSIIFPLLRPATAALGVVVAVSVWGDFLPPLIVLGPLEGNTITVGVYRAIGQFTVDLPTAYSFLWLASIPVVIVFVFAQRQLVTGLVSGAVKH